MSFLWPRQYDPTERAEWSASLHEPDQHFICGDRHRLTDLGGAIFLKAVDGPAGSVLEIDENAHGISLPWGWFVSKLKPDKTAGLRVSVCVSSGIVYINN